MARHKDAILAREAHAAGRHAPMVDLVHGGQQGYMADYANYVSNARYIRRNVIPLLIEAPRGFNYMPNGDRYIKTLKALVELHATAIDGLQSTLEVSMSETPLGGAGEMQEDVINVTRARSTPTFTWPEKYGKPINAFLESWIVNLLMDPETKFPAIINSGVDIPTDLLPDFQSMTMLFIEPDPTHTKVMMAWLCTNMKPKTGGVVEGKREIGSGGEEVEYTVEFSAITQVGRGVDNFAQRLLNEMTLTGANPNLRNAFVDQITADIKAGTSGYVEAIKQASASAISG